MPISIDINVSIVTCIFDYLLKDKENLLSTYEETTNDHGRKETRTYYVATNAAEIRDVIPRDWTSVSCLGMAVLERICHESRIKRLPWPIGGIYCIINEENP